jgi:hypothetical protein
MKRLFLLILATLAASLLVLVAPACRRDQEIESYPETVEGDPSPVHETDDLTVGWMERLPAIDFVWNSPDPAVEGWPAEGQPVTWRVHVRNWSDKKKKDVSFQWKLDGDVVDLGRLDIPANSSVTSDFQWNWTFARHDLDFVIEPEKGNRNHLKVDTDSLSLGLYVEKSVYDYFHEHQHELKIGSNSFEGWAQRQMRMWNEMLRAAVYPETPRGVMDRIRIDGIHVVADGALPLSDDYRGQEDFDPPQSVPNFHDLSVDLQWGFPAAGLGSYSDHASLNRNNQFFYSGFLQHELGHARYLVDVYGFDVYHCPDGCRIDIMENGEPVAGSKYMPGKTVISNGVEVLQVHETLEKGLMNTQWSYLDRYSAVCMNQIAGRRAVSGNFNAPENFGVFLDDLPRQNRVSLKDQNGRPLAHAGVLVFQSSAPPEPARDLYPKYFDARPDMELEADGEGRVLLGRCPFSNKGRIFHLDTYSNTAFIMRVEQGGRVGYVIKDISLFNLEFWRGNATLADYTFVVQMLD